MSSESQATRDAIDQWQSDGSDLSQPMEIDFFVAVPDEASGQTVATAAQALGFATNVEQDSDSAEWTCYCTITIVPSFEAVRAAELQLDEIAKKVGGYADGFGSYGNAPSP